MRRRAVQAVRLLSALAAPSNMRERGWAHHSERLAIESGVGLPHCRKSCRRRWCTEELVQPARCAGARAAGACAAARRPAAPGRHDRPKSCCNMRCVATCAVLQHGTTWYRPAQTPRAATVRVARPALVHHVVGWCEGTRVQGYAWAVPHTVSTAQHPALVWHVTCPFRIEVML